MSGDEVVQRAAEACPHQQERDFYRKLLDLGECVELEPFVADVLALIVEMSRCSKGYIELYNEYAGPSEQSLVISRSHASGDEESFRSAVSQGVITEVIATRTSLNTLARDDPKFSDRRSVRERNIGAVLCTPLGGDPPIGVLYLQDRKVPGLFTAEDQARAEMFARHLTPLVDRLLLRRRMRLLTDPTAPFRCHLVADEVIGRSPALAQLLEDVSLVAGLDVSVLLSGESGTGKTQIARVLHQSGRRRSGPFIELNCAALPESLVEGELFGSVQGAHSTATKRSEGKIAAAEGGTLFLDEVAELSMAAQATLLQLLQSREYFPLGSPRAIRADVRIIAATNVDLQQAIARRQFRLDLYYRLNVMAIRVPSLRERREDLVELAEYMCRTVCARNRLPPLGLSPGARQRIVAAEWPGNIRELGNVIERAAIRAAGRQLTQIEAHHLFPDAPSTAAAPETSFQDATRSFQEQLVRQTLEDCGWNVTEAARRLDLSRAHVYNLIGGFGLIRQHRQS